MNKLNQPILPVLACLLLMATVAFAVIVEQVDTTGNIPGKIGPTNPLYTTPVGPGGATATIGIVVPSISDFDNAAALIATGTVSYLQAIASFTDGDQVFFTGSGQIWYFPMGAGDTHTVASVKAGGLSVDAGGAPPVFKLNTTTDFAFVADSAVSTLTIFLGKE